MESKAGTGISFASIVESRAAEMDGVTTHAAGPAGALPISAEMLLAEPSGNLFGLTQNAGMGWEAQRLLDPEFLILSTHGGLRAEDGKPIALGFHTGHWEVGLLVAEAARELKALRAVPFAGACTDPCDGRTQGTTGMMDSLPYRNDAAMVLRRLMRSLPTRKGVLGVATCDKGLPAMMMALASAGELPAVLVPGGVTLLPETGEDAGKVQTIGARFAQQQITLEYAAEVGCRACASPGGGCQFLGTAATSQVVGEALGLSLPHTALAPSGQPVWLDAAKRSARALVRLAQQQMGVRDVLTPGAVRNAMVVHAAFGGSTNLLLHLPAVAFSAGLRRPTVEEWAAVNRTTPRLVDALPNGPRGFATVQVFLAGGVPEVMLALRAAGLLDTTVKTVTGETLDASLDWWQQSERRQTLRRRLKELDGIDADEVIMTPEKARSRGLVVDGLFSAGEPCAGGLGDQVHGNRFVAGRGGQCLPSSRAGARLYHRGRRDPRDQERRRRQGRRGGADLQRPQGRRDAGDLPDHVGLEGAAALQACRGAHRCAVQRSLDRGVPGAHFTRGAGRRPRRQGEGRRPHRDRD